MSKTLHYSKEPFQDPEQRKVLELLIPLWLLADLLKIQAARGIPLNPLLLEQLEFFVIDNWDLENDQPRVEMWNE